MIAPPVNSATTVLFPLSMSITCLEKNYSSFNGNNNVI